MTISIPVHVYIDGMIDVEADSIEDAVESVERMCYGEFDARMHNCTYEYGVAFDGDIESIADFSVPDKGVPVYRKDLKEKII